MKGVEVFGEPLKRDKIKASETTVNGHVKYNNGQLVSPKKDVSKEARDFIEKKEKLKKQLKGNSTKKQLPSVDPKYQAVANLNYMQDAEARQEIIDTIEELWKIEGIVLAKTSNHDLSVRCRGRQIVRLSPLKKGWSASIKGSKIQKYTKQQVLDAVNDEVAKSPKEPHKTSTKQDDEEVIASVKERIAKMSKDSKGISVKGIKITKAIKQFCKDNGYSLTGETLLVNRVK